MKKNLFNNIFKYKEQADYEFVLSDAQNNLNESEFTKKNTETVSTSLEKNLNLTHIM